ncbi:MAG: hypothetical protein WCP98_16395, partial [Actinomycetes bacterium]
YRIHVVALRRHWEAAYFPRAGYPITRGWYRQADAIHNGLFYTPYDAATYVAWLRRMGVQYVFLPDAPLDPWSHREVRILRTSPEFAVVERSGAWTVYRLRDAEPLAVGLHGGTAHVTRMGHQGFAVTVDQPGAYLLKVTWSPYWSLVEGAGALRRSPDRFLLLDARVAGRYTLRFDVTPGKVLTEVGARLGL